MTVHCLGRQLQIYSEADIFEEKQLFGDLGFEQMGKKAGSWQACIEDSGFQYAGMDTVAILD